MGKQGLAYGPIGGHAVHLCIDMQRLFDSGSLWAVEWMRAVMPELCRLTEVQPARTIFTRFIPPRTLDDAPGMWRRYYAKWPQMLGRMLDDDYLRLLPELEVFTPPALVFDKTVYSPWVDGRLHTLLRSDKIDTLVISGGETEICVLATVMGAVDLGYRVIVVRDAICSSADNTHDAALRIYSERFSIQVEMTDTAEILAAW